MRAIAFTVAELRTIAANLDAADVDLIEADHAAAIAANNSEGEDE